MTNTSITALGLLLRCGCMRGNINGITISWLLVAPCGFVVIYHSLDFAIPPANRLRGTITTPVPYHRSFIEQGGEMRSQRISVLTNQTRPN